MTNSIIKIGECEYRDFCKYLESQCGIVLGDNKQYLVRSRLTGIINDNNMSSLSELLKAIQLLRNFDLKIAVINAMTTNETLWFRDSYPFEVMARLIFPELSAKKKPIKIWSAASSSGQEAYSVAMTAIESSALFPNLSNNVSIVGTDISFEMLSACNKGEYDQLALNRGLSKERRKIFFEDAGDGKMCVNSKLKRMVSFRQFNLMDNYALLGKFDVIFCRNVLIYFSPELKAKILTQMAASLNPGGYLFLGASETLGALGDLGEKFEMIRCNPGIVYRLK